MKQIKAAYAGSGSGRGQRWEGVGEERERCVDGARHVSICQHAVHSATSEMITSMFYSDDDFF
jgi:hypothetical protein